MKKWILSLIVGVAFATQAQTPISADFLAVRAVIVTNAITAASGVTNFLTPASLYKTNVADAGTVLIFTNIFGNQQSVTPGSTAAASTNASYVPLFKDVELAPFLGSTGDFVPIYGPTNNTLVDYVRPPIKIVAEFLANANAAVSTLQFKPIWYDNGESTSSTEWLTFTATTAAGNGPKVIATNIPPVWFGAKAIRCVSVSTAAAAGDSNVFTKICLTGYAR